MKEELEFIGKKIINNKKDLAAKTLQLQSTDYKSEIKETSLPESLILEWRTELFHYLGEALFKDQEVTLGKVIEWAKERGKTAIENGVPLDKTIQTLALYRTVIWDVFKDELAQHKFAAITVLDVSKILNPIIDKISHIYSHIFVQHNQKLMEASYHTIQELSVPVVPLSKKVAVVPLIGEIDTYRSKLVMETTLQQSTELQIEYLLIDVSGVPIVDTVVAHNLFQIVNALKLIGVDATITGIRPEIASTVVSLGIDFSDIKTRANLYQALEGIGFSQTVKN